MNIPRRVSVERRKPRQGTKRTLLSSSQGHEDQGHEESSKGDQDRVVSKEKRP